MYKVVVTLIALLIATAAYAVEPVELEAYVLSTLLVTVQDSVSEDSEFIVSIEGSELTNVAGFQMDIEFTDRYIKALSVSEGSFLSRGRSTHWVTPNINNGRGTITNIACVRLGGGGVSGSGTLIQIKFQARRDGVANIVIRNAGLATPLGDPIPVSIINGTTTVVDYPAWDVNHDGRIDITDLILVGQHFNRYITGNPTPNPDVNRDGRVNLYDLVIVIKHLGEHYGNGAPARNLKVSPVHITLLVSMYKEITNSDHADKVALSRVLRNLIDNSRTLHTTWGNIRSN